MAISAGIKADKPEPYAPAGDLVSFFEELEYVPDPDDAAPADSEAVLPALDDAFEELAAELEAPAGPKEAGGRRDDSDEVFGVHIERHRASFAEIAAETDPDPAALDDDPSYLTNPLYRVPPENTRFEWVDDGSFPY